MPQHLSDVTNPSIIVRLWEVYENGNALLFATTDKAEALKSLRPGDVMIERDWEPSS